MSPSTDEVLVFTPTPNEFGAVKKHIQAAKFKNFSVQAVESGPGKINATFKMTSEVLPRLMKGHRPLCLVGAGTSGSLNLKMAAGDLVVSRSSFISDWRLEDDSSRQHGAYGLFTYGPVDPGSLEKMTIHCPDPIIKKLVEKLNGNGFQEGRLMTSDTFVAGSSNKLTQGRDFDCLACDMESGAFAYTAQNLLGGLPWFNLRVVADTLDETLEDYFQKEVDMVEILGRQTAEALKVLDGLYDQIK